MTTEEPRPPEQPHFVIVPPPDPWLKKYAMKIVGSLACASIVAIAMNYGGVKWGVLTTCKVILGVFDRHPKIPKVEKVLGEIEEGHLPKLGPTINIAPKSPEQLKFEAEQKEANRIRREESERKTLLARAEAVKFACNEETTLEELRVNVPAAEKRAREEPERKLLHARADKIGLEVDPAMELKPLKQHVEKAEKALADNADYQAALRAHQRAMQQYREFLARGPNARCPNSKCGHLMRIEAGRANGGAVCSKCNLIFPCRMGWAHFTPPAPPRAPHPPGSKKGLLKRASGFLFG